MNIDLPSGATPIDISDLKQDGILTYAELCEAEAENILKAVRRHLLRRKVVKLTPEFMKKVHKDMFGDVWSWAGKYRKTTTNVGIKSYLIPVEVQNLCDDVLYWNELGSSISILERAIRIHHRLVWIHPFENGNGRHARLIADMYLNGHGSFYPRWPIDLNQEGASRLEYIQALKDADRGDYNSLTDYISRLIKGGNSRS